MTKKERVIAAIEGRAVDYIPSLFSLHFPSGCGYGEKSVDAHLDFFARTDTDIIKIMNENLVPDFGEIRTPADWKKIPELYLSDTFMNRQIELVKSILEKSDKTAFSVGTVHGICASAIHPIEAKYGYTAVRELFCAHLREDKAPVLDAFKRISDGMCRLVEKYKELGLDGIYYASLGGEKNYFTNEEFSEAILPFDHEILKASKNAGLYNFLHICKDNLDMQRYASYNSLADVVNWGVFETNFSIEEGRDLFPQTTVMGGLANRSGVLADTNMQDIAGIVHKLIHSQDGKSFILGADCTLPTETPYQRINEVVKSTRNI